MSEQQVPETTTAAEPAISDSVRKACDIATGKTPADPSETGRSIFGAKKDLNSKGRGEHWYRMVYRSGGWEYVSDDRLPSGSFLASDRRCDASGDVYAGEIVIQHDRGGPVDVAYLVISPDEKMRKINFVKQRDGQLRFELPDGSEIILPNPRAK